MGINKQFYLIDRDRDYIRTIVLIIGEKKVLDKRERPFNLEMRIGDRILVA